MLSKLKNTLLSAVNRAAYGKPPEGGADSLEDVSLKLLDGTPLPVDAHADSGLR